MIAVYVVLDGFDLGAGIVQLLVARTDRERRQVLRSIGPVWDGNEVWLLAGGGTLYFAFPALYASSFSGFYLPLMMVLWLLILRGISIEFRNHIDSLVWKPLLGRGVRRSERAAGHLLRRGAGQRGARRAARWGQRVLPAAVDQFRHRARRGHSGLVHRAGGGGGVATLTVHGALWVALKTEGEWSNARARWRNRLVGPAAHVAITWSSFAIQPRLGASFGRGPGATCFRCWRWPG
jgi:cytochrome d ubiquinol oxidase subunit II